ncbi:MAG: LytTR family transcriptional regulator [Betaproteobacteria bacterium]|nr:LytTR family transcriptional regulator [Betaproteobacteria bacterium]
MPVEPRTDASSHCEPATKETFQHKLEQFNPGMVWLDAANRVVALNDVAMQILGPSAEQTIGIGRADLIGIDVLKMHPEKSRDKLSFLLKSEDAPGCPVKSPPPMAMMINIPDRVLMIKVSKMLGNQGIAGTCMIFYDLTEVTTIAHRKSSAAARPRILQKIPVYRKNRIVLVDLKNVVRFEGEGHYTSIETLDDHFLCNLSLSDLEERLNPEIFFRVHRSHIVNLNYVVEIERADDNVLVIMDDKGRTHVPVSRNRVPQFKELLGLG